MMLERTQLDIVAELRHARAKFPMPNPTFVALVEEVGELAHALLTKSPAPHVYSEAIQVAVMAIRVAEEGDKDYPDYHPEQVAAGDI